MKSDLHPWSEFLYARRNAIIWLKNEMDRSDFEIAETLSMDSFQVYSIRASSGFNDNYEKIRQKKMNRDCRYNCDCKPDSISFFWMNDNHTFTRLSGEKLEDIINEAKKLNKTSPAGMLCPPTLLRMEKDFFRFNSVVHEGEDFEENLLEWVKEIENNEMAMKLIDAGKIEK